MGDGLLLLNGCLLAGLALLLPLLSPRQARWRIPAMLILMLVLAHYGWWRITATMPENASLGATIWSWFFLITESLGLSYAIWQALCFTRHRDRRQDADQGEQILRSGQIATPRIDLYIPTYNEPASVLTDTIIHAVTIDYPDLQVWVCDDGDRDWLRDLCREHGVGYIRRPIHDHGKGGNLDHGIRQGNADLVACIDADFRCLPGFAYRLAGILTDPAIGLVQAPQHFRNADPIQRNLAGSRAWTEEQRLFFDVALPARDAWGNGLCVGSCWAARRTVFDQLDGYPTDTIVEDVYLGYAIKGLGYQTAYLNEPVATGLAPEDLPTYLRQRSRWCQGAMTLISAPKGPCRLRSLGWLDRIFYFDICWYWLGHLQLLSLVLAPIIYGLFGLAAFTCSLPDLFGIIIPRLLISAMLLYWVSEGRSMPLITPVKKLVTIFHVLPALALGLFRPWSAAFKVSDKGVDQSRLIIHWRIMWPFLTLGALTLLSIIVTFRQELSVLAWSDYSALNAMLAAYTLISLFLCCLACIERPPTAAEADGPQVITGSIRATATALFRRLSQ